MDSINSEISQNKKMEKITQIFQTQYNLTIINQNADKSRQLIIAKDETGNEYSIKIISICDGSDSICDQKLHAAIQEAKILSNCNHPSILKYVTSFQIDTNYFIQMQKCKYSLQHFVDNNESLDEQQYTQIALQILHSIQYLHEKNYVLRDISLKNILLDDNKQIKLCDFGFPKQINSFQATQEFLTTQTKGVFFYLPPEIYEQSKKNDSQTQSYQTFEGDVWKFGICMYILAGASLHHILQFTQGLETYQIQKSVNIEINLILLNLLKRTPNQRPTVKQMIDQFNQVSINKKDDQKELMNQVQKQFDSFDFNSSIGLLLRIIEMNPVNDQYLAMLGQAYLEIKKIDESIDSSMKSIEINPQNDLALSNLGICYYKKGDIQKSLCFTNKSLEINSNNYMALTCMSYIRDDQKKYDEAIELCKKSLSVNPNYTRAYNALGIVYKNLKMYDLSIEYYKKALQINPNFEQPHNNLGNVYQFQNKFDLSIECYTKALQINPNFEYAHNNLGIIYQFQKKYDLSIECHKKALQINPNFQLAHIKLGQLYLNQKEYDLSIECFKKSLQINPNNLQTHNQLGIVYRDQKTYDLSIECFKKALQINPNFDFAHKNLGYIYKIQSKYDLSIQYFKKALKINPNDEYTIGQILILQKKI